MLRTNTVAQKVAALTPSKRARVWSFIRLMESEPDDEAIYEELSPEEEDALLRRLSFAPGSWDDE